MPAAVVQMAPALIVTGWLAASADARAALALKEIKIISFRPGHCLPTINAQPGPMSRVSPGNFLGRVENDRLGVKRQGYLGQFPTPVLGVTIYFVPQSWGSRGDAKIC